MDAFRTVDRSSAFSRIVMTIVTRVTRSALKRVLSPGNAGPSSLFGAKGRVVEGETKGTHTHEMSLQAPGSHLSKAVAAQHEIPAGI